MPGIPVVTKQSQRTYKPAVGVTVIGGQLVEGRASARIGPAVAGSLRCLGVAVGDATAPESLVTGAVAQGGRQVVNAAPLATLVAVVSGGAEVPVTYAAPAAFGELLIAAANGQVTPAGAAPDARTIVGRCTEPNGVAGAGQVGLARITC